METYRFRTDLFELEPGEDEETNPRIYGRQLATWLKAQLERRGHSVEPVINEDWGRCLMCSREPFRLWVGCGSVTDYSTSTPGDLPPDKRLIEWQCFAVAEPSLMQRWFRGVDGKEAQAALEQTLREILSSEPRIRLSPPDTSDL